MGNAGRSLADLVMIICPIFWFKWKIDEVVGLSRRHMLEEKTVTLDSSAQPNAQIMKGS